MSMRAVIEKHIEEGYVDTTYYCTKCGAKIAEFREYAGERMIVNWDWLYKCSCGALLVREVKQIVPDMSESKVIEVGEEGGDKE